MVFSSKLGWFIFGFFAGPVFFIVLFTASFRYGGSSRPEGPPEEGNFSYPFGAIIPDKPGQNQDNESDFEKSIKEALLNASPEGFDSNNDGIGEYEILALTGGGSNGAFGAGVLCGWSESGTRPEFKVVMGVSTGALQATIAFLGSEYDYNLEKVYTSFNTENIYIQRPPVIIPLRESINYSYPLKMIIEKYVTERTLEAVATRHAAGRRLYVGTTNLDRQEFVIWDMGKIASSGRDDALELYRKVLLASASIPVLLPPVYFEVESRGEKYYEMHCDGNVYVQYFFQKFILNFKDAVKKIGLDMNNLDIKLYVINNGRPLMSSYEQVSPKITSIAGVTINSLFDTLNSSSLYKMYVLCERYGVDFNIATISKDKDVTLNPTEFDPGQMKKLFDYGYGLAKDGYDWIEIPPGVNPDGI